MTESRSPGRPAKSASANVEPEVVAANYVKTEDVAADNKDAEIAALKAQLEELKVAQKASGEVTVNKVDPNEPFTIHFVADGLTLLEKVWYTGQSLRFDPNGQAYKDTCDINGFSILELRNDPRAQEERLGKEFFRDGPWKGRSYADIEFERLKALASEESIELPTKEELKALDEKERARNKDAKPLTTVRSAPHPRG